jgi:putative acetyltransferase
MFVQPGHRDYKIGHKLLELISSTAKVMGYKKILLDTLPSMTHAIKLYHSFDFKEEPSYRFNPVAGAVFTEKKLV